MNSIEIDDQVFAELERRVTGFHVTPNDVLRRILELPEASQQPTPPSTFPAPTPSALSGFLRSEQFQQYHQAVDKYLAILNWLHMTHLEQFGNVVMKFQRGTRTYFAKSEKAILENGKGVTAKQIPQSPFWALTTLDNKSKRLVLEELLRALRYSLADIKLAANELKDSGIRRNHGRSPSLEELLRN